MPEITHIVPETWQALEQVVADILGECGMDSERNVHVDLPRGGVDLDVRATDLLDGIETRIVCECKHWATAVPQQVAHAFRTVVAETGAHQGYIISRAGFQAGAYEAVRATNIDLLDFVEFQNRFFARWSRTRLEAIEVSVGQLNTYYEPFGIPGMDRFEVERERAVYYEVWLRHLPLGVILSSFSPYLRRHREVPLPDLPFVIPEVNGRRLEAPAALVGITGYREFLATLEAQCALALRDLRALNPLTRRRPAEAVERDD